MLESDHWCALGGSSLFQRFIAGSCQISPGFADGLIGMVADVCIKNIMAAAAGARDESWN
jgi:hypothetical protein